MHQHGAPATTVPTEPNASCREMGIEPQVTPEEPKMGPMVKALADFFESRKA